jgi:two-component system response regulator NreC
VFVEICWMGSEELTVNDARIRVLVADDHLVLRAGLRLLLDAQPDMEVV